MKRFPTHWQAVRWTVTAAAFTLPLYAGAAAQTEADLKEQIILVCHNEMGEFGADLVRQCIETETAALNDVSSHPDTAEPIVSRCKRVAGGRGWGAVKVCVDQDIAAAAALDRYPGEQAAVIEQCRTEAGQQGSAKVKACVDQRIAAQPPPKR